MGIALQQKNIARNNANMFFTLNSFPLVLGDYMIIMFCLVSFWGFSVKAVKV